MRILQNYKFDESIWKGINKVVTASISNITVSIPKRLRPLPEIPIMDLLNDLQKLHKVKATKSTKFPLWGYILIAVGLVVVWLVAKWLYKKFFKPKFCKYAQMPRAIRRPTYRGAATSVERTGSEGPAERGMQLSTLLDAEGGGGRATVDKQILPRCVTA